MFGWKKKKREQPAVTFDPEKYRAVLRCSICNGEQVAGFKDLQNGHFIEVCLIRGDQDLNAFKKQYGVTEVTKEY